MLRIIYLKNMPNIQLEDYLDFVQIVRFVVVGYILNPHYAVFASTPPPEFLKKDMTLQTQEK